jgi:hypothetical protein
VRPHLTFEQEITLKRTHANWSPQAGNAADMVTLARLGLIELRGRPLDEYEARTTLEGEAEKLGWTLD